MRITLLLFGLLLLFSGNVFSQDVPRIISYQGVLVGADGRPVTAPAPITITISLYSVESSGTSLNTDSYPVRVIGGLFSTMINIPQNIDLNQQLWLEIEALGKKYPRVKMASALYALNIADNVVTSEKINDGQVKSQDLDVMGATDGQVLTRRTSTWHGETIPKELPASATEGDVLVYKNGAWQAEKQNGVPVGTIVAFYGLTKQIPSDWKLCDGSAITQIEFPLLFTHLIALYNTAQLPDLRGQFLRGASLGIANDPDSNNRVYPIGIGTNTEKIGSEQQDAFQGHGHKFTWHCDGNISWWGTGGNGSWPRDVLGPKGDEDALTGLNCRASKMVYEPTTLNSYSLNFGAARYSSETRPKNISVNYIIKAK